MDKSTQQRLMRRGAEAELADLRHRIHTLEAFIRSNGTSSPSKRGRRMSTAAKKAISARMKAYWAERKKGKK